MLQRLFLLTCLFSSSWAGACSCLKPQSIDATYSNIIASGGAVFEGIVETVSTDEDFEETQTAQIRVITSWTPGLGEIVISKTPTVCCICGVRFREGQRQIFFLHKSRDGYRANACTPATREATQANRCALDQAARRYSAPASQ